MNEQTTEAIYEVRLATHPDNLNEARELLTARLQDANYPIREIEVIERDEETIEVVASLLGTSANREELDAVSCRSGPGRNYSACELGRKNTRLNKDAPHAASLPCSDAYGARAAGA